MVDFLATSVDDVIRPFRDSNIEVTRRWYRVPWGTPTIGVPSVFMSPRYQAFDYLAEGAGPIYPERIDYARRGTPDGLDFDHVCGTAEDFELGGLFDPAVNVVYDDEWIPECCGRQSVCVTQLCDQEPVNGRPAAELYSYPIPHQDADEFTPVLLQQAALNQGNQSPAWPGYLWSWFPGGDALDPVWSKLLLADDNAQLQEVTETARFAADNAITNRQLQTGWELTVEQGGDSGTLTAAIVGGVLHLDGTNVQVQKQILPPDTSYRDGAGLFGSALATATQVPPGAHVLHSVTSLSRFFQLIDTDAAEVDVYPSDAVGAFGAVLFPPTGQAFNGLAVNAFIAMTNAAAPFFAWRFVRVVHPITGDVTWNVLKYRADGTATTGTVTTVGISTSSTGLTVGVTNPTTTPALTVDLSADLEQLVGFPTADAILAGDGTGNWVPVTIGDFLSYSGGVLDVVPPTATQGHKLCSTFAVTAATTVFQATGDTFTLPAAGTYLITGRIRAGLQGANLILSRMEAKLRDTTAGADVPDSTVMIVRNIVSSQTFESTAGFSAIHTVTGASVIELYAARVGTTWTFSSIMSDADGQTTFDWVRLF